MRTDELVPLPLGDVEPVDHPDDGPKLGDWFWVEYEGEDGKHLSCITSVGSNHYELKRPLHSYQCWRIGFERFRACATPEPNADAYIASQVKVFQNRTQLLLEEVRAVTARLGLGEQAALPAPADSGAALVRAVDTQAPAEYKAALVRAQEEELPALFEAIKDSNETMAAWMTASLIPLKVQASGLEEHISAIRQRVFHVELYAGLCESVERITDGEPAPIATPIHLMQRRHYMDEECLVNYDVGGMEFRDIRDFDAWIARPANRDRILPHPRCVVAFRVRRYDKEREVNLSNFIRVFYEKEADRKTFLYIRNGDQLWRLSTGIDFDEQLFPDFDMSDSGGKLWAEMFGSHVKGLITDALYQQMKEEHLAYEERCEQWEAMSHAKRVAWAKANGISLDERDESSEDRSLFHVQWHFTKEAESRHVRISDYSPYDPDCLYYDEISKFVAEQRDRHNRVVLVLQGLLDRSPVFHPHPPWSLWSTDGFASALRLAYDSARALHDGDKPDFEAYRQKCNETLRRGSVTVGQDDFWQRKCAERENARYRGGPFSDRHLVRYRPDGDPGPGLVARIVSWSRSGVATFRWRRESRNWRRSGTLSASIAVPRKALFNVDAYQLGDYKRFFADPRTREEYLQWAPILLAAEEYKAGKRAVQNQDSEEE